MSLKKEARGNGILVNGKNVNLGTKGIPLS
jgi:hypothetical protein